jgi:hypothetical protein
MTNIGCLRDQFLLCPLNLTSVESIIGSLHPQLYLCPVFFLGEENATLILHGPCVRGRLFTAGFRLERDRDTLIIPGYQSQKAPFSSPDQALAENGRISYSSLR